MNSPPDKDAEAEREPEDPELKASPGLIVLGLLFLMFGVLAGLVLSSASFR